MNLFLATTLSTGWNTTADTVAGTGTAGIAANQFKSPYDIVIDSNKSLYIVDKDNHRVQKWLQGASSGTTIAGVTGISNTTLNYLSIPRALTIDPNNNVYIADTNNHRVVLWNVSSTSGVLIAGTGNF